MDYRGGDLDLRTPKSVSGGGESERFESASMGDYASANGMRAAPPIYVDDTLMACCNHAYDVAVAHRSADVRIEHLLYALTRVDRASEVLEAAGIRDAALRRDAATVIASEIPIGMTNGSTNPRRSLAFEEALRLAAQQGYRRNRPASVSDLLHVFLEVKPDLQGLELLRRHLPRGFRDNDDFAATAARYQPEPQIATYFQSSSRPPLLEESRPARYEPQDSVDAVQNARLADLEAMVRSLRDDLSHERQAFSTLVTDVKRDLSAQRTASASLSNVLQDRFASMEQFFASSGSGSGDGGAALNERFQRMERGVAARIEDLNRHISTIASKIDAFEPGDSVGTDLSPLADKITELSRKLDAIERRPQPEGKDFASMAHQLSLVTDKLTSLEQSTGDGALDIDIMPILGRLDSLERAVRERDVNVDLSSVENRLGDIETAVTSQDPEYQTRRFQERIDNLEEIVSQRFTELSNAVASVETGGGSSTDPDLATALQSEIKALAGAVAAGNSTQERFVSSVQSEIQSLASRPSGSGPDLQPLMEQFREQLRQQLETVENRVKESEEAFASARSDFVRELSDVHEAIMKLNSNQHAISQSIEGWRGETVGSVNTVSNRLIAFEQKMDGGSHEDINRLSHNLDRMYRLTVERYHKRNRFWFWLFGTDDWIGASWPSQTSRVEDELRGLRESRD